MTEPRDPNEPGWGAPQQPQQPQQPQWGSQPEQPPPGWGPPPPGYGQQPPPPGYGQPPPPYGAPPQYGTPGNPYGTSAPYGYYAAEPPTDGKAVGALVAAILSWLLCPIIPAVVALVLAGQSSREIARSGGQLKGAGLNTAAKITAWVNIVIFALLIAVFVAFAVTASETSTVVEYGLFAR